MTEAPTESVGRRPPRKGPGSGPTLTALALLIVAAFVMFGISVAVIR